MPVPLITEFTKLVVEIIVPYISVLYDYPEEKLLSGLCARNGMLPLYN